MRFAHSRRTFLSAAVLVLTPIGKALAEDRAFELAVHDAKPPAQPAVLSVLQNDRVVVRVTSDKPLHVHLHGYDIEGDATPDIAASLRFTATATGRFPIEMHSNAPRKQRPLAYLEVRPR